MTRPRVISIPDSLRCKIERRLLDNLRRSPSGCWEWSRSRNPAGYGKMGMNWVLYKTHRIAYTLFCGQIPDGLCVCHHCDNPPCCRPDHLFLGTASDNQRDMVAKGRHGGGAARIPPENRTRGQRSHFAKLTDADVLAIRDAVKRGDRRDGIARRYGVTRHTVRSIAKGLTWMHLPL